MRKTLCTLICMVMVTAVGNAAVVPESSAQKIAESFFASSPQTKASVSSIKLLWDGLEMGPSTKSFSMTPPFYVYGLDGENGFVIVSGNDICRPVLGYSYEHSFDPNDIPDGMRDWFEMIRAMVNEGIEKNLSPNAAVSSEWKTAATKAGKYTTVKKLETALWDQQAPYNLKSPELEKGKGHTYTGCANTATAIVMKYWNYPEAGTGTIDDYEFTSSKYGLTKIKGHSLGHKYDWDNMLMDYTNGYTTAQGNAVATLMYDLGVMNKTKWGYSATGAFPDIEAYVKYMGYDRNVIRCQASDFADMKQWYGYLKKEIDEERPVLYVGYAPWGDGHAFVLDGYATNDYFSFNWGWSGSQNGYFTIDPSVDADDLMQYHETQYAFLGLKPDDGIENSVNYPFKMIGNAQSDLVRALHNKKDKFTISFTAIQYSQSSATNKIKVALMRDTKVLRYLSDEISCTIKPNQSNTVTLEIDTFKDFTPKDCICIGYIDDSGAWTPYSYSGAKISLRREESLSGIVTFEEGNGAWRITNNSSCGAYIEGSSGSRQFFNLESGRSYGLSGILQNAYYNTHELTITVYDLYDSYEMTIKG